jgi:hypothetical protein
VEQKQQKRTTVKRMSVIDRQAMVDSGVCFHIQLLSTNRSQTSEDQVATCINCWGEWELHARLHGTDFRRIFLWADVGSCFWV